MKFTIILSTICMLSPLTAICLAQSQAPVLRTTGVNIVQDEDDENIVTVTINDEVFTRYHARSGSKPILWPIYGPTGKEMTRRYPMREPSTEHASTDHAHHRSFWFSHGDVNGLDFWLEPDGDHDRLGAIKHREFVKIENGEEPTIVSRNDWLDADGETLCSDIRTLRFGFDEKSRWIDFDIVITNTTEKPVVFGDTKEGCFAIRVAPWMKVNTEEGELETNGHIVNSLGKKDKETWGQPASWVDYHAELDGTMLGIAILNHPNSFRFPTFWHVRTYGLFAANVFGLHNFKNSDEEDGSHEMLPEQSISFYYRVLFHRGDEQGGRVPEAFVEYAKIDKATEADDLTADELVGSASANSDIELVEGAIEAMNDEAVERDSQSDEAPATEAAAGDSDNSTSSP